MQKALRYFWASSPERGLPMAEFLGNVLAATVAGILVVLVARWLDRR